jgi:adenine-specific DNA-methyltransferase
MNDDLVSRTEIRRVRAMTELDADRRAELGQFFTPRRAAALIADMPRLPSSGVLRVLDAGAGAGSLTAALVDRILREAPHLQVEVVAVDVDEQVVPYLAETLADCETTAARHGTGVTTSIITTDFISCAGSIKTEGPTRLADCDIVVMNPPYAKLSATSAHRRALARHGVDCPNLYAASSLWG